MQTLLMFYSIELNHLMNVVTPLLIGLAALELRNVAIEMNSKSHHINSRYSSEGNGH